MEGSPPLESLFASTSGDAFEDDLCQLLGIEPQAQDFSRSASGDFQVAGPAFADGILIAPPPPALIPTKQEPVFSGRHEQSAHSNAAASTRDQSVYDDCGDLSDAPSQRTGVTTPAKGPKRRRRIRNEKQQELNRLAQQRYRERKKQKAAALATQVDELAEQLAALRAKDVEIEGLKKAKATLEQTVASQESALQSATAQLAAQQHTLVQQAQKLADQEKALAQIAERAQRPLDASALSERLAEALREALTELGANVDKSAVDKLTSALTRSLTSCGKDARALLALPSKLGQEQRSPTMPMPPVSCF